MISASTKSESASEPRANEVLKRWRLSRTLKRATDFRPIEADDIRYLWAAYKKGALASIGFSDTSMGPEQFKEAFENAVIGGCHAAWTLFAMTSRGFIPVGVVFATWAPGGAWAIVNGATFMPWASCRNIIESMVGFLDRVRKEVTLQFYAEPEHKRLYEVCAMHGVVRRVGTSYVIPGKVMAMFETRNVVPK